MINLDNIHIILKKTRFAGNIGAAARSMANFGLKNMILVSPRCKFNEEAYARARQASFIFENAPIYDSLDEIASSFQILIGTSVRGPKRLHLRMPPGLSAEEISKRYFNVKTGIIFGDEKAGLSNKDLEKCAWYITIPTTKKFYSMNLAHSITVIAYELFIHSGEAPDGLYKDKATQEYVESLFSHMVLFLKKVGFPVRGSSDRTYADLKRLVCSADLKRTDVNLLHGLMRYLETKYMGG